MAKRKLGRGLDILIGRDRQEEGKPKGGAGNDGGGGARKRAGARRGTEAPSAEAPERPPGREEARGLEVRWIPVADVEVNPTQPRKSFSEEELAALKRSVSKEGVLQPVLVRRAGKGYQLIAGERRLRAAKELSLREIPARVVEVADDRLMELALIENIHREDLNPIELAEAYRALMDRNGWTQDKLAEKLGVSRPLVGNTLRLLDLPDDMQGALVRGQITAGHAKVLLSVLDDAERRRLFDRIAEENLSVRELEDVRDFEAKQDGGDEKKARRKPRRRPEKKPYIVSLEEEFSERLGTRVRITERKNGRGVLSVEFYSRDDFERLRQLLLG